MASRRTSSEDSSDSGVNEADGGSESGDDDILVATDEAESIDFLKDDEQKVESMDFLEDDKQKALLNFYPNFEDVTHEFADVEIFLISMDSLLIELCAHKYHNWTLGGQTVVLIEQLERFLSQLAERGGKFKLVWFTEFQPLYAEDVGLAFLRAVVIQWMQQSGRWQNDVVTFASPIDPAWQNFLADLTPSFLLISADDPSSPPFKDFGKAFASRLISIMFAVLQQNIPVVELVGMTINVSTVCASRMGPRPIPFDDWDDYLRKTWRIGESHAEKDCSLQVDAEDGSLGAFWAAATRDGLYGTDRSCDRTISSLASAILLAALVIERRGTDRCYLNMDAPDGQAIEGLKIHDVLFKRATQLLSSSRTFQLNVADIWDGRLVVGIYNAIAAKQPVLPIEMQEKLAELHKTIGLDELPVVDKDSQLLQTRPPAQGSSLLSLLELAPVSLPLLHKFTPEVAAFMEHDGTWEGDRNVNRFFDEHHWHHKRRIEDDFSVETKIDTRSDFHKNRAKQYLSRWYAFFARSLEGDNSCLLVDFTRSSQVTSAGGAKQSKSALKIKERNRTDKEQKATTDELNRIDSALKQDNCVVLLENFVAKLKSPQAKARCKFEIAVQKKKVLNNFREEIDTMKKRRLIAMSLVGNLKDLFKDDFWQHLNDKQRSSVNNLWDLLGFDAPHKTTLTQSLSVNMVDYQMAVAGELIDIQLDPQFDPRVTGFDPDGWQRELLDVVDKKNSALIIAPTSAGKTFVSYYCIEKVLRESHDDVVIYVSPTKALVNQVAGSIYARFRNKVFNNGRCLFGVFTRDFQENVKTCQVLITVPQCLEILLMSATAASQDWCRRIKYVIFDEVHCIGSHSSSEMDTGAVVWEHTLLMIRCPFLALSATIGNAIELHEWLTAAEKSKSGGRTVELITYGERWAELEMAVQSFNSSNERVITELNPFSVYMPDKLKMFGIPADQQLTARQVFDLFTAMAEVDPSVESDLQPAKYFGLLQSEDGKYTNKIWLTRKQLRNFEAALKQRFMDWLKTDSEKLVAVLRKLDVNVRSDLDMRSKPFDQRRFALRRIVPLVDHLHEKKLLPAICFSDDRDMCEDLALKVGYALFRRERQFLDSDEYKEEFGQQEKDAKKRASEMKRKQKNLAEREKNRPRKQGEKREIEDLESTADAIDSIKQLVRRKADRLAQFRLGKRGLDEDLFNTVIARLRRKGGNVSSTRMLIPLLKRGIGYHHSGMPTVQRQSVEILFRSGHLAVVFSTSTLALGINMPCKTVVFGIDSNYLTPLQFRQMCGRAGRRGFDRSGQVVFLGLPTGKIRRLLTASLGSLRGSVPFTISFVLRLLTLVSVDDQSEEGGRQRKKAAHKHGSAVTESALTLLRNAFVKYTSNRDRSATLDRQFQFYFGFAVQLLRQMSLLDKSGAPTGFAGVINHLHYHEPGNLVFVYLLQNGAFHQLCKEFKGSECKSKLLLVLAHLFTNVRLPRHFALRKKQYLNSLVVMDPLPAEFESLIKSFNEKMSGLFAAFLQQMSVGQSLQGDVFALTGRQDCHVDLMAGDIVKPLNKDISFDQSLMPVFGYPRADHRGNKSSMNAYACDFYLHAIKQALVLDNGLREGDTYHLLNDFQLTLSSISTALSVVGDPKDVVVSTMAELAHDYKRKFLEAFPRFKNG